jgi:hypothetical protein
LLNTFEQYSECIGMRSTNGSKQSKSDEILLFRFMLPTPQEPASPDEYKLKERERKRKSRAIETPEQRALRLEKQKERQRNKRATENEEQRLNRLAKDRERKRKRRDHQNSDNNSEDSSDRKAGDNEEEIVVSEDNVVKHRMSNRQYYAKNKQVINEKRRKTYHARKDVALLLTLSKNKDEEDDEAEDVNDSGEEVLKSSQCESASKSDVVLFPVQEPRPQIHDFSLQASLPSTTLQNGSQSRVLSEQESAAEATLDSIIQAGLAAVKAAEEMAAQFSGIPSLNSHIAKQ